MVALQKNRHLIIAYTIIRKDDYVTSDELATITNSSTRTIKSDILYIGDVFKENGGEIISKKSDGYTYQVTNPEKFESFRKKVYLLDYYYINQPDLASHHKRMYIIRRVLSAKNSVKIDDIADELYISRSAMKREMAEATEYLQSYRIKLVSVTGHGVHCEGDEKYFRLCALGAFGITYHDYQKEEQVSSFSQLFDSNYEEFQAERRIMLMILRKDHYYIRDNRTQSLARYFVLMKNRMNEGIFVTVSEKEKQVIKGLPSYKVAVDILENIESFFDVKPNEDEIAFTAIYLFCYRDFSGDEITPENTGIFYENILDTNSDLVNAMRVRWGIEIDRTAFDAFLPISAQCVIRNHFGFTGFNEMIFSTSTDVIKQSPLSIAVGQSVINRICKRLSSTGNTDDVFLASYIVYGQLKRMSFPYKPMKIAVVSVLNRQVAKSISQFIQNQFSEYIESIDGYELYELRSFSHEELDYVIMDGPEFIYNYDFPRFIGNRLSIGSQVDELWKSVFVHGCQIQGTVDALSKMMKVYDAFDVPDRNNCFKMLAYKYGKDEKNSDMIHSWFMQNEERFRQNNYSSILFLTMARKLTKRDVFDIYRLKNALPDGEILKIKYVVCCSIDFVDNPVLLLGVNDVMESITSDLGKIDDLIDCEPEQRNALLTEFITERLKNSV